MNELLHVFHKPFRTFCLHSKCTHQIWLAISISSSDPVQKLLYVNNGLFSHVTSTVRWILSWISWLFKAIKRLGYSNKNVRGVSCVCCRLFPKLFYSFFCILLWCIRNFAHLCNTVRFKVQSVFVRCINRAGGYLEMRSINWLVVSVGSVHRFHPYNQIKILENKLAS